MQEESQPTHSPPGSERSLARVSHESEAILASADARNAEEAFETSSRLPEAFHGCDWQRPSLGTENNQRWCPLRAERGARRARQGRRTVLCGLLKKEKDRNEGLR